MPRLFASCLALAFLYVSTLALAQPVSEEWPSWRGPLGNGTCNDSFPAATTWDGKNRQEHSLELTPPV